MPLLTPRCTRKPPSVDHHVRRGAEPVRSADRLVQRKPNPYHVGPIVAHDTEIENFTNALHEGYDDLNPLESTFARALDGAGVPWFRNPPRSGYGIPLVDIGDTETFYPDFIFLDRQRGGLRRHQGPHILHGEAGRKLLSVTPRNDTDTRLEIRFVTAGEWNADIQKMNPDGYTIWGLKSDGKRRAQHFPSLDHAVDALIAIGS
jgi:type III restriction enzyme